MVCSCSESCVAARLAVSSDYRVLRRLDLDRRALIANDNAGTGLGVCIDVETTGTDVHSDEIIELSLRRFRFDEAGVITKFDRVYSWLEQPTRPLDPMASAINGLAEDDLRGRRIDDDSAIALLGSAQVRVAFHAAFDRKFVERRLPTLSRLPWACAMREIDWRARGFDGSGRSLGWLLAQCGFYNDRAHRAAGDVDATIAILEHRSANGTTALHELLETASQTTWHVRAVGAHFDVKDRLKGRGYRWDPLDRVWTRDVGQAARGAEEAWLAEHVYAPEFSPRMDGPAISEVTWFTRHG